MPETRESRPKKAAPVNSAGGGFDSQDTTDHRRAHADAADVFEDCYAVVVYGRLARRHIYLNLPAAERAVRRAHARGDDASMALVQLVPVDIDPEPAERVVRRSVDVDEMLRDLESSGVTP